jgi:hypothetical protein
MIMYIIVNLIIFTFVLIFYLHTYNHTITNNDREVLRETNVTPKIVNELCGMKQPYVFTLDEDFLPSIPYVFNKTLPQDTKINLKDLSLNDNTYVPVTLEEGFQLLQKDTKSKLLSQKNNVLLDNPVFEMGYEQLDLSLRPLENIKLDRDLILGSNYVKTPLRYELSCRNFFYIMGSEVFVKLYPPSDLDKLDIIPDYEELEFTSNIDVWDTSFNLKDSSPVEIALKPGEGLFVPPYWLYSFCLTKKSQICKVQYKTFFNMVSILPYLGKQILQKNNTKYLCHERQEYVKAKIPKKKPRKGPKKKL